MSKRLIARAERIVRENVQCNVTGLISSLAARDDEDAINLMGSGDDYPAYEVWAVTPWLAAQLERHDHRVEQWWNQHYWARGATGQAISMDSVIKSIAQERP